MTNRRSSSRSAILPTVIGAAMLAAPLLSPTALGDAPSKYRGGALPEDETEWNAPAPLPFRVWSGAVHTARGLEGADPTDGVDASLAVLPASFDLRHVMPPVDAQGECGSCTAFAAVAALEGQITMVCGAPRRLPFPLSEQYAFSCGGGACRTGMRLSAAVEFVADVGVPDEPCLPYRAASGNDVACTEACGDASDRAVLGLAVERPTSGFINIADIKSAMLKGPLASSLILFEDLMDYRDGVYRHVRGNQVGSHAIVLVGWDDAKAAWLARNSWGAGFGDQGYFWVAYDDASLPGRYTWRFDVSRAVASGLCSRRL